MLYNYAIYVCILYNVIGDDDIPKNKEKFDAYAKKMFELEKIQSINMYKRKNSATKDNEDVW